MTGVQTCALPISKKLAIELQCFHGDGCNSGFSRYCLQKALPIKSMEKYDEVQCEISIKLAGLTDMCSCPKCGFQADVPSGQKVFQCPVAKVRFLLLFTPFLLLFTPTTHRVWNSISSLVPALTFLIPIAFKVAHKFLPV